ncbi:hypothetical protein PYW08_011775 [Mythimna loreyi]|uniref:Uncharacterized protein n=1 Tax=Mythimna loreyi TaxID=667449 RepID=A0ACC2QMY6_9NEOP|nr:hypothetical protein PYW08_011775 [Mythimna loreyi]
MGFQLFMTTGIMMFSTLFGGSMMLKPGEKKFQHFFLELCAVLFGLTGSLFALGNMSTSIHALSGFAAGSSAIAAMLIGPLAYITNPHRVRFAGPFDDRVIEDSGYAYSKTVLWAVLVGISYVLLGTVVMSTSIYSYQKGEFHGALFSLAYHFCAAEGILALSFINGWATPMRKTHRQYAHVFLQTCTIICAVFGIISVSIPKMSASRTVHGLSGLLTLVLTAAAWTVGPFLMKWVVGPFVLRGIRPLHIVHKWNYVSSKN